MSWRSEARARALGDIMKDAHLKHAVRVERAHEVRTPYHTQRRTGVLSIDCQVHIPAGTVIQLHGPKASGKTATTQLMMAALQRSEGDDANIAWLSFGYKPDLEFWRMCGVQVAKSDQELEAEGYDLQRVTAEQRGVTVGNIDVIDLQDDEKARAAPAEALLGTAIRLVASGAYQLIIVEELGSGITKRDAKKDFWDEASPGSWSNLMSNFLKNFYDKVRYPVNGAPNDTNVVVINPVRANLNASSPHAPKTISTSGYALEHAMAVNIRLSSGKKVKKGEAKEITWRVLKAKHGGHEGVEGVMVWDFETGVDLVDDAFSAAVAVGTIVQRGSSFQIMDRAEKYKGKDRAKEALYADDDLTEDLKEATIAVATGMATLESVLDGTFWEGGDEHEAAGE